MLKVCLEDQETLRLPGLGSVTHCVTLATLTALQKKDGPIFSGREEDFYVWTKKIENYMSGVFPNVRGALAFAAESQDVVTTAAIAIGVAELGVETSAEIDVQLFVVLSALTEGESFDIVMSAGCDHGFESWRKLHGRWNPYTAGRARSLLREILLPTRAKLPASRRWKIS